MNHSKVFDHIQLYSVKPVHLKNSVGDKENVIPTIGLFQFYYVVDD